MSAPKSIGLSENPKGITVEWTDGHPSVYAFSFLRRACPCALCKGERTPLDPAPLALPVLKNIPPEAFNAQDMFKVGRYAIGLRWGDGHDTGIYTFDYLRQICPCEQCLKRPI